MYKLEIRNFDSIENYTGKFRLLLSFIDRKFNNKFRVKYYKIHIESFESNIDIFLLNVSSQNFEIFMAHFDPVTEKNYRILSHIRFGFF